MMILSRLRCFLTFAIAGVYVGCPRGLIRCIRQGSDVDIAARVGLRTNRRATTYVTPETQQASDDMLANARSVAEASSSKRQPDMSTTSSDQHP